jgi:hypothetical protein
LMGHGGRYRSRTGGHKRFLGADRIFGQLLRSGNHSGLNMMIAALN